jgi:hypothetical protein
MGILSGLDLGFEWDWTLASGMVWLTYLGFTLLNGLCKHAG